MKLANVISGQFANLFQKRGEVEPNELIKALEREVAKQKSKENLVPNAYTIYLCAEDCHRLSAARLIKSLYEAVERKIIRENCFMDGNLSIKIEKNTSDGEDAIIIASNYIDAPPQEEDTIDLENDVLSQTLLEDTISNVDAKTIVAEHTKIIKTMRTSTRKINYDIAVITNDFVIADESASRIHAYVAYERHRHVLYDAGSLNGTTVNKKPISRCELRDGDKILIGNTKLTYKVL